jgi:hypothetical protein
MRLVASMWTIIAHSFLFWKAEGTRPPGRHRRRWNDEVEINLEETGWKSMDANLVHHTGHY